MITMRFTVRDKQTRETLATDSIVLSDEISDDELADAMSEPFGMVLDSYSVDTGIAVPTDKLSEISRAMHNVIDDIRKSADKFVSLVVTVQHIESRLDVCRLTDAKPELMIGCSATIH